MSPLSSHDAYPPKADLRKEVFQPLPVIPPGTVDAASLSDEEATKIAVAALGAFNAAVETNDAVKLVGCFHSGHTFWRDMVALTAHLRTFKGRDQIAAAFLETKNQRKISGQFKIEGSAHLVSATPTLVSGEIFLQGYGGKTPSRIKIGGSNVSLRAYVDVCSNSSTLTSPFGQARPLQHARAD
jgi:ketosteroid isomerase-like protein